MHNVLRAILLVWLTGCAWTRDGASEHRPAPTANATVVIAEWIARADPEIAEHLGVTSLPWVTEESKMSSLPLPPGFQNWSAKLPSAGHEALEVGQGAAAVRLIPVGAHHSPLELEGHRAVYRNVYPSTDSLLVNGSGWVEQLWVLHGPEAPTRFEWDVSMVDGALKVSSTAAGGLKFTNPQGQLLFHMPQPFGVDASGRRVEARAEWTGTRVAVVMDVPKNSPLVWPVLLDPVLEGAWTNMLPATSPPERSRHAMAALGNKVVLFGGLGSPADTWEWDGTAWTRKTPAISPPSRGYHSILTALSLPNLPAHAGTPLVAAARLLTRGGRLLSLC
jgi:hypothetical protein